MDKPRNPVRTLPFLAFAVGGNAALIAWRAASAAYQVDDGRGTLAWGAFAIIAGTCAVAGAKRIFAWRRGGD